MTAQAGRRHSLRRMPSFFLDPRRACNGKPTNVFFPDEHSGPATVPKAICRRCPFVDECREFAIERKEVGVWGATTAHERKGIRDARKREGRLPHETRAAA